MTFGTEQVLMVIAAVLTTYIVQNIKLREGLTEWLVTKMGRSRFTAEDHTVLETIKGLQYESHIQEFDNKLKENLYNYYINTCLTYFSEFAESYIKLSKEKNLADLKKETKLLLYTTLNSLKNNIDSTIKMPDVLQDKFDTFRNYLDKQHIYVLEKALHAPTKSLLNIQLLDALETNIRWMFFYATDMFEGFNGHFDSLFKNDIFVKIKK